MLNDLDANIAIVTQGDGRSPRAVSPPNAQVWSTSYDAKHNRIYLLVVTDTNHDGKFDNEDAPLPYALNLDTREAAIPLLSGATRDGVERLLK